ncbi:MAG: hypothetical protein VYB44_01310 [Bacteroidota bacterium]|nr:hypothetical protein [Bacteroidota bacterium]
MNLKKVCILFFAFFPNLANIAYGYTQDTIIYSDAKIEFLEKQINTEFYRIRSLDTAFVRVEAFPNIHNSSKQDSLIMIDVPDSFNAKIYKNYLGRTYLLEYKGTITKDNSNPFFLDFFQELARQLSSINLSSSGSNLNEVCIIGVELNIQYRFRFNDPIDFIEIYYINDSVD